MNLQAGKPSPNVDSYLGQLSLSTTPG